MGEISPEDLEPGAVQPPMWLQVEDMNPGTTATASSISFRLPITEVCPQLTPLLLLPTHFSLTTAASSDGDDAGSSGARTDRPGISPEPLLEEEMSPELVKLKESSEVSTEEMVEMEVVEVNSESTRSSCPSSDSDSITQLQQE